MRSADGRFLAGGRASRRAPLWDRPHLLDVVTGEVASLPRTDDLTRQVLAVHDGTVYYRQASTPAVARSAGARAPTRNH